MFVNPDTLTSLQIIGSEAHPNKYSPGSKESLSLFGLFKNRAVTPQGRFRLRQMFLRPSIDLAVIYDRQRSLTVFLRPENHDALRAIHRNLGQITNMRGIMNCLERGVESRARRAKTVSEFAWATLLRFSSGILEIWHYIRSLEGLGGLSALRCVLDNISTEEIAVVGEIVGTSIDIKQTRERRRTIVSQGVDPQLDALKREYDGMVPLLTEAASEISAEIPEWARRHIRNCSFFPQIGFLTVVSQDPETGRGHYEGEASPDPSWDLFFSADTNVYYKNKRMRQLDKRFGDIYCAIHGRFYSYSSFIKPEHALRDAPIGVSSL